MIGRGQTSRTVFLCLLFSTLTARLPPATGGWCVLALASHGIVPDASCLCGQSRQLWLLTAPALAFCTKPGPSVPFTAHGTFPTVKAGDSSSLSCGPLCYTTHLQWWIPPEMYGNVSPCHQCLTSNLRARDSLRTCLLWLKRSPWWQSI